MGDGRSRLREGRAFCILGGGDGGDTQSTCCGYSHPRHFFAPCQKGGRGWIGGLGEGHPHGKWSTTRSCRRLERKKKWEKRKEKGGDGWREDERASPCQMKHRTQLSPAAGSDTSYVLLPLAVHAPGAPNALCLFCSEWQKMPKIQYWGQTYQDCSWKYMVIFFNCPLKS